MAKFAKSHAHGEPVEPSALRWRNVYHKNLTIPQLVRDLRLQSALPTNSESDASINTL
jgi:hypothetical protein